MHWSYKPLTDLDTSKNTIIVIISIVMEKPRNEKKIKYLTKIIKPLTINVSFSGYCAHSWQRHDGRLEVLQKSHSSSTITQLFPLKRSIHEKILAF